MRSLISYTALVIFALTVVVNLGFLLWDAYLLWSEQPTISRQCWQEPILIVGFAAWQIIGPLALVVHLLIDPHH